MPDEAPVIKTVFMMSNEKVRRIGGLVATADIYFFLLAAGAGDTVAAAGATGALA